MKFGKMIQKLGRELPNKHFLRYKDLKKLLKLIKRVQGEVYCMASCWGGLLD